jgi:hypothetical protein
VIKPCGQRYFLAEIARQIDQFDTGIGTVKSNQRIPGAVAAAIVDSDDFIIRRDGLKAVFQARKESRKHGFFVMHGDDDGDERHEEVASCLFLLTYH